MRMIKGEENVEENYICSRVIKYYLTEKNRNLHKTKDSKQSIIHMYYIDIFSGIKDT